MLQSRHLVDSKSLGKYVIIDFLSLETGMPEWKKASRKESFVADKIGISFLMRFYAVCIQNGKSKIHALN